MRRTARVRRMFFLIVFYNEFVSQTFTWQADMTTSVDLIRIGRRGQIVLPRDVRYALGVAEGDRLAFIVQDGEVTLKPVKSTLLDLRGSVPAKGAQDFDAVRSAVRESHAKKVARGRE